MYLVQAGYIDLYPMGWHGKNFAIWMILALYLGPSSQVWPAQGAGKPADISFYQPSCQATLAPISTDRPRNVIMFIGDGMGFGQVSCARIRAVGPDGRLWMERMPVTGIVLTHSANSLVTDSAAAATAMACGIKTDNNMVGRDPNGPFRSILEAARSRGLRTGLVVTKSITDATPAGFAVHVRHRDMQSAIAVQLLAARVDVLFGGGRAYFLPSGASGSKRRDRRDLLKQAGQVGYSFVEDLSQVDSCYRMVIGLFAMEAMTTMPPEPSLALMTRSAIQVLDAARDCNGMDLNRPPGFFLMVEGSQIDTACHNNDLEAMIRQVLLFDMAVKEGLEFASKDGQTLILVTADHETGGLQIVPAPAKSGTKDEDEVQTRQLHTAWTNKAHTGLPVPIYAYGPKAILFTGVLDNTEIPKRLCELLGIGSLPERAGPVR